MRAHVSINGIPLFRGAQKPLKTFVTQPNNLEKGLDATVGSMKSVQCVRLLRILLQSICCKSRTRDYSVTKAFWKVLLYAVNATDCNT